MLCNRYHSAHTPVYDYQQDEAIFVAVLEQDEAAIRAYASTANLDNYFQAPRADYGIIAGDTPLHYAAKHGDLRLCRVLIEQGANPLCINSHHQRPLELVPPYNEEMYYYLKEATRYAVACGALYQCAASHTQSVGRTEMLARQRARRTQWQAKCPQLDAPIYREDKNTYKEQKDNVYQLRCNIEEGEEPKGEKEPALARLSARLEKLEVDLYTSIVDHECRFTDAAQNQFYNTLKQALYSELTKQSDLATGRLTAETKGTLALTVLAKASGLLNAIPVLGSAGSVASAGAKVGKYALERYHAKQAEGLRPVSPSDQSGIILIREVAYTITKEHYRLGDCAKKMAKTLVSAAKETPPPETLSYESRQTWLLTLVTKPATAHARY